MIAVTVTVPEGAVVWIGDRLRVPGETVTVGVAEAMNLIEHGLVEKAAARPE